LPGKEPVFFASNQSCQDRPISQASYQFGRNDRDDENLPPSFRDWTKQDLSAITPEERQIRVANRPTQMVKTSIPIPRNTYSAIMQNNHNPEGSPVEFVASQPQWNQHAPQISQYVPELNPIMEASHNAQPQFGQAPMPLPTDIMPVDNCSNPLQKQERIEQQGNTTITYSKEPRTFGYDFGTNPLSRAMP